jgi:bifunctional DNA-binding transcriptional regulator/antitoxin component of YhaV-PrlF toxin-antitoxin module
MDVDITKMSSKGQIVVPVHLRKQLNAKEGTLFAMVGTTDSLMLKKVATPSKGELIASIKEMANESARALKSKGLGEKDVIRRAVRGRGQ